MMVTLKQCNINKQITENVTSNTLEHITADKYEEKNDQLCNENFFFLQ